MKHTVVQPIRSSWKGDTFTPHWQRENLAGKNPANRAKGHAVGCCESVYTTNYGMLETVANSIRNNAPNGRPGSCRVSLPIRFKLVDLVAILVSCWIGRQLSLTSDIPGARWWDGRMTSLHFRSLGVVFYLLDVSARNRARRWEDYPADQYKGSQG